MNDLTDARQRIMFALLTRLRVNGYKLRMSQCKWYLNLYYNGADLGFDMGPFGYHEARAVADERFKWRDLDKE